MMSLHPLESNGADDINRVEDLKVWSCINCRRRKVRCDRRHPCAPCTRGKTDCVFPVSGRVPRRSHNAKHPPPGQKQAVLLGRLRRLEAMVGDLSSQVEHAAAVNQGNRSTDRSANEINAALSETSLPDHPLISDSQLASGSPHVIHDSGQNSSSIAYDTSEPPQGSNEFEKLVVSDNGDLVIGDQFWTVFCKEVEQIFEAIHGPTATHFEGDVSSSTISMSDSRRHNGFYNFLLGHTSAAHQQKDLHPLPSQMLFLWQTYMDNVDPFMKVLHIPTMTKVIRDLRGSYSSLSPSMQALVLAISLAAIMSLKEEEVHLNFNNDKYQIIARFRLGTEQALAQADFFNKPDIIALQALTIYLGVLQHTGETTSGWFLAGVLVRVAVSMKLHRDGSRFANMTPFEIEMRRRLWWQICFIDSRSEDMQVSEYKLSEGMFDTEIPVNMDDINLHSEIPELPVVVERWTDMTVFLIRSEVWKLSRRLHHFTAASHTWHLSIDKGFELFQQSQAKIEDTYLKHINHNEPLHSFVVTSARLFLTKIDLILYVKQQSVRSAEAQIANSLKSDRVLMLWLSVIEYTYLLQNEPGWSGWSWQIQGWQPPWNALRAVLSQLSTRCWEPICERIWSLAKRSFDSFSETARKDPRYQQLSILASTVERKQADELHHQNSGASISAHMGLTSATALNLSAPLSQVGIGGTVPPWIPQEPFLVMAEDSNNTFHNVPSLDMDWQVWDEIAGELESSSEFWDLSGL